MSGADKAAASEGDAGGSSILLSQPIVLDNGTSSVKAGFAGGSKPKVRREPLSGHYALLLHKPPASFSRPSLFALFRVSISRIVVHTVGCGRNQGRKDETHAYHARRSS